MMNRGTGVNPPSRELLGQMSERLGAEHYGEERQESQVEKAEQVVAEELRRRGLRRACKWAA